MLEIALGDLKARFFLVIMEEGKKRWLSHVDCFKKYDDLVICHFILLGVWDVFLLK